MTTFMSFNQNFAVHLVDNVYNEPLLNKYLHLGKLNKFYKGPLKEMHLPLGVSAQAAESATFKTIPSFLLKRMLGYMVEPRSFHFIHRISEASDLEAAAATELKAMKRAGSKTATLQQARDRIKLLTHYLHRIFNPRSYVETLHRTNRGLTAQQAHSVKKYLNTVEQLTNLFDVKSNDISFVGMQELKRHPIIPANERVNTPLRFIHRHTPNWLFDRLPLRPKPYTQKEYDKAVKALESSPLKKMMRVIKNLDRDFKGHNNDYLRYLSRLEEVEFLREIKGDGDWMVDVEQALGHKYRSFQFKPQKDLNRFLIGFYHRVMKPLIESRHGKNSVETRLFADMLEALVLGRRIRQIHATSEILRTAFTIVSAFIMYSLVGGFLDNQFILPYQRKITKLRGDTREMQLPLYLGAIPCFAVFLPMRKLFPARGLGRILGYAISATAGMLAYAGSSMYMIHNITKHPRDTNTWTKLGLNPFSLFPGKNKPRFWERSKTVGQVSDRLGFERPVNIYNPNARAHFSGNRFAGNHPGLGRPGDNPFLAKSR